MGSRLPRRRRPRGKDSSSSDENSLASETVELARARSLDFFSREQRRTQNLNMSCTNRRNLIPRSSSSFLESRVSFMNKKPKNADMNKNDAVHKFGSAYGNSAKNFESPKTWGYCRTGSANLLSAKAFEDHHAPPKTGPRMLPALHTKGITLNARAW